MSNSGKDFEQQLKKSIQQDGFYYCRLNDPAQSFDSNKNLRFSPKNPYDCFFYAFPNLFTAELKSTKSTSMTFYREDFDNDSKNPTYMIKKHQIEGLLKASEHKGIISGFILNFRATDHTYFLHIGNFIRMTRSLDKKSFNEQDIVKASGLPIKQTLKRTKYKYHIQELVNILKGEVNLCKN